MSVFAKQFNSPQIISFGCGFFGMIIADMLFFTCSAPYFFIPTPRNTLKLRKFIFRFSSISVIASSGVSQIFNSIIRLNPIDMIKVFWQKTMMPKINQSMRKVDFSINSNMTIAIDLIGTSFSPPLSSICWWIFPNKKPIRIVIKKMLNALLVNHYDRFNLGAI